MNLRRPAKRRIARSSVSTALPGGRKFIVLTLAPILLLAPDSACFDPANVSFTLGVPSSISSRVAWVELGAYSGACPPESQLAGGIAQAGAVARVVFAGMDPSTPSFGDLPKATYGFAAVARASDCSVIGEGCSVVNVGDTSSIAVRLSPVASPAGACEPGNACVEAVCVPQLAVGSGCSLTFVGGGPLADPLGVAKTVLSAPAIVTTNDGFLIAYREYDPDVEDERVTLIPVDDLGAASPPQRINLPHTCATRPQSDATALAWNGSSGVVAVAWGGCMTGSPGLDIYAVDAQGVVRGGGFSPTTDAPLVARGHALAFTPAGLLLATVDANTAKASVKSVSGTTPTSTLPFGDVSGAASAYVAGTSLGTGLLALGSSLAGEGGLGAGDGSAADFTGSFTSLGSGGSLSALPAASDFPGSWASLSGVDSRILVTTSGSSTSAPIVWYAFDVGLVAPAYVDSFGPQVGGNVIYTDVALHADNAFFAAAVGDSISLFAFRKASTYPELIVEKDFATDDRIPIATLQDGLVAVAADATRVAVVWGTASTVTNLQDLGGYAVFACVP
jgi:hypothetical protein